MTLGYFIVFNMKTALWTNNEGDLLSGGLLTCKGMHTFTAVFHGIKRRLCRVMHVVNHNYSWVFLLILQADCETWHMRNEVSIYGHTNINFYMYIKEKYTCTWHKNPVCCSGSLYLFGIFIFITQLWYIHWYIHAEYTCRF